MKSASKLLNLPFEYYVVIFLFIVVILMSVYGNGADYAPFNMNTSLSPYPYEGFKSEFPQKVHNAANSSGQEVPVLQGDKGVLGIFEAEGLKAAPIDENTPDSEGGFGARFSSIGSNLDYAISVQKGRQSVPYFSYNPRTGTIEGEYPRTWIVGGDVGFEA